jgi:hypothetical protein
VFIDAEDGKPVDLPLKDLTQEQSLGGSIAASPLHLQPGRNWGARTVAGKGRPFQAGQSGNPAGKAKGTRNGTTVALENMFEDEARDITRKVIELAKDGDTVALRLCLDRLMPVRKDRPILFTLPPIDTAEDLTKATNALLQGVAAGEITPSEAAELSKLVDAHMKAIEAVEFASRLAALEQTAAGAR